MIRIIFDGGQIAELNNVERIIIDRVDQIRIAKGEDYVTPDTHEEVIILEQGIKEKKI